jgi:hypothetical protein
MEWRRAALMLAACFALQASPHCGAQAHSTGSHRKPAPAENQDKDREFERLVMEDLRRPLPTDGQLALVFRENKALFERLVGMVQSDANMVRIDPSFTWTTHSVAWPRPERELGIAKERWDEYRRIFALLRLKQGVLRRPDDEPAVIYFIADSKGLVVAGSMKGYSWSEASLSPRCKSLDVPPRSSSEEGRCFKPIAKNWYLYYEWD